MRKGEPAEGLEFYALLYADDNFCKELGRAVLAAGRLESELKRYISNNAPEEDTKRATLGRLIKFAREHQLLLKMLPALEMLRDQRNYLAHNIHALFSGLIEETILEATGLLDSDVDVFTDRARQLQENLNGLADIMAREMSGNS
jgi:hypothetical protein